MVPVRISTTYPRFWHHGVMYPGQEELVPRGIVFKYKSAEFDERYWTKLNQVGIAPILKRWQEIADEREANVLVLACYEAARSQCHRKLFCDWWQLVTGEVIEEWDWTAGGKLVSAAA